jgi:uncharacterized membrane protein
MRKVFRFFLIITLAVVTTPAFVFAQSQSERIDAFYESAYINADGTVKVSEKIVYNFDSNQKHGIFRTIPVSFSNSVGKLSTSITGISVKDEKNNPYTFTTSKEGKNFTIKIGDADKTISGIHTYIISYTIADTIGFFKDYDEWYWNVTGNEWNVPIGITEVRVNLPQPIEGTKLKVACYAGSLGSTESCGGKLLATSTLVYAVDYSYHQQLNPSEGLTVAVGFPKGYVHEPTFSEKLLKLAKDNWILFLPLFVFIFMLQLWYRKGRDPKGTGTIIAEYESPENLSPLQINALLVEEASSKTISAEIIYLATKGYIKIEKIEKEKKFGIFSNDDYVLHKLKDLESTAPEFEQELMNGLFGVSSMVRLSDLKNKFYTYVQIIKEKVGKSLVEKGYYLETPRATKWRYMILGIVILGLFFVGFWLGIMHYVLLLLGLTGIISIVLSAIIIIIFGRFMPRVTDEGARIRERIKGLKEYITVAEADRIRFHNAPAKNPELFEKLLPFAMVFGAEKLWAKEFEGIYTTQPSWYQDSNHGMFNAVIFTNNLSSFNSMTGSALTSSPQGASGGGSAFSGGGGFSGGGFGGGGGGSW